MKREQLIIRTQSLWLQYCHLLAKVNKLIPCTDICETYKQTCINKNWKYDIHVWDTVSSCYSVFTSFRRCKKAIITSTSKTIALPLY